MQLLVCPQTTVACKYDINLNSSELWADPISRRDVQHTVQNLSAWLKACDSQGSCTTTPRPTTAPSTWRASATCCPLCPCSWSRWLSAGRLGTNWVKTRKKTAARPKAASPPTASGTASCRKNTRERPPVSRYRWVMIAAWRDRDSDPSATTQMWL